MNAQIPKRLRRVALGGSPGFDAQALASAISVLRQSHVRQIVTAHDGPELAAEDFLISPAGLWADLDQADVLLLCGGAEAETAPSAALCGGLALAATGLMAGRRFVVARAHLGLMAALYPGLAPPPRSELHASDARILTAAGGAAMAHLCLALLAEAEARHGHGPRGRAVRASG